MGSIKFRAIIWHTAVIAVLIKDCRGNNSTNPEKISMGSQIASRMMDDMVSLWQRCAETTMPGKSFLIDNLQNYVNYPARTTIGFAPKFTANRKFLGNLISSTEFKTMLEKDGNELRLALIAKLKYCDEAIMDQEILKDFYDREVDSSKLRKK